MILNEGGNVFKDPNGQIATTRINKADVAPTLDWLEKVTGLELKANTLGTTGIAPTSGDIDVLISNKKKVYFLDFEDTPISFLSIDFDIYQ